VDAAGRLLLLPTVYTMNSLYRTILSGCCWPPSPATYCVHYDISVQDYPEWMLLAAFSCYTCCVHYDLSVQDYPEWMLLAAFSCCLLCTP
jgi:hypothetical protein